jgi:hypothetical protein
MGAYSQVLREIKYRIEDIDILLSDQCELYEKVREECCYLQLRMICELIAFGCLIVHKELNPNKSVMKSYEASKIMISLKKMHKKFFPQPIESEDVIGGNFPEWKSKESGFFTQTDLIELWARRAGSALHRGRAASLFSNEKPVDFDEIRQWRSKIIALLNRHTIVAKDEKILLYCIMNSRETGEVYICLFAQMPIVASRLPATVRHSLMLD